MLSLAWLVLASYINYIELIKKVVGIQGLVIFGKNKTVFVFVEQRISSI